MSDLVRLTHRVTHVAIRVDAATAERLGAEWARGDLPPAETKPPAPPEALPEAPVEQPEPTSAPTASASRGEWAAYAESLGITPGDSTKADLIEAVKAHTAD